MNNELQKSIGRLNDSQKEAVYWNTTQKHLNKVRQDNGSTIVLAAAGSGKTTTLTLRIANLLLNEKDISPNNVLAVTFTNKAAKEMKERIEHIFDNSDKDSKVEHIDVNRMWIGTFHSICYRILNQRLRLNKDNSQSEIPTLKQNFSIIDPTEQKSLIKKVTKQIIYSFVEGYGGTNSRPTDDTNDNDIDLEEEQSNDNQNNQKLSKEEQKVLNSVADQACNLINILKENCVRSKDILSYDEFQNYNFKAKDDRFNTLLKLYNTTDYSDDGHIDLLKKHFKSIYKEYELICSPKFNNCADFAELLLAVYDLLNNKNSTALKHYSNLFKEILVDEFQDTNQIQYKIVTLLASKHRNLFVVGDDDQSIYGFRGAVPYNFQIFKDNKEFNPHIIKIENNYRSKDKIVSLANAIIENNVKRMGKNIVATKFTEQDEFVPIYREFDRTYDEAKYIAKTISTLKKENQDSSNAILYRINSQSRSLEQELIKNKIPYIIHGGLRFFDREEIKYAVSYLRVIDAITFLKPEEIGLNVDNAIQRIINLPNRGIGDTTLERIDGLLINLNRKSERQYSLLDVINAAHYITVGDIEGGILNETPNEVLLERLEKVVFKNKKMISSFKNLNDTLFLIKSAIGIINYVGVQIKLWCLSSANDKDKRTVNEAMKNFNCNSQSEMIKLLLDASYFKIKNMVENEFAKKQEILRVNSELLETKEIFLKQMEFIIIALKDLRFSINNNNINDFQSSKWAVVLNNLYRHSMNSLLSMCVYLTGVYDMYQQKYVEAELIDDEKNMQMFENKMDNLKELLNSTENFSFENQELILTSEEQKELNFNGLHLYINEFLTSITLDAQKGVSKEESANSVHLMTIHSAKGLEFDNVFISGFSNNLLPHSHALSNFKNDNEALDEERRLAYVAITRARDKLFITHSHESGGYNCCSYERSEFLKEIKQVNQKGNSKNLLTFELN